MSLPGKCKRKALSLKDVLVTLKDAISRPDASGLLIRQRHPAAPRECLHLARHRAEVERGGHERVVEVEESQLHRRAMVPYEGPRRSRMIAARRDAVQRTRRDGMNSCTPKPPARRIAAPTLGGVPPEHEARVMATLSGRARAAPRGLRYTAACEALPAAAAVPW